MQLDRLIKTVAVVWCAIAVVALSVAGAIVYVAYHFISKWW